MAKRKLGNSGAQGSQGTVSERASASSASSNVTKEKLSATPFSSVSEMNAVSREIRSEIWRQLERARIKRELLEKSEYQFVMEPFRKGVSCRYKGLGDNLVRVYLGNDGGIEVDINEEMMSLENAEALLNALVRSASDSLLVNYLRSMEIVSPMAQETDEENLLPARRRGMAKKGS